MCLERVDFDLERGCARLGRQELHVGVGVCVGVVRGASSTSPTAAKRRAQKSSSGGAPSPARGGRSGGGPVGSGG